MCTVYLHRGPPITHTLCTHQARRVLGFIFLFHTCYHFKISWICSVFSYHTCMLDHTCPYIIFTHTSCFKHAISTLFFCSQSFNYVTFLAEKIRTKWLLLDYCFFPWKFFGYSFSVVFSLVGCLLFYLFSFLLVDKCLPVYCFFVNFFSVFLCLCISKCCLVANSYHWHILQYDNFKWT